MPGVKGKSGRRPLSVEAKRLQIIDKGWNVVDQYLSSKAKLQNRAFLAVKLVTKDQDQRPVTIENKKELHLHFDLRGMSFEDLQRLALGRPIVGHTGKQNSGQPKGPGRAEAELQH